MAYNRDHFFEAVRAAHGPLKAPQVEGFTAILAEAETRRFDKRWTAYVLATAWWESDKAMQAVPEIGKGHGRPYGVPDPETKQTYYGRGLVQLTWKTNYAKMAKLVGVDLVAHPDLALELGVAVDILFDGMQLGTFTGKRLVDYFTAARTDWTGARHIVNGTDHATDIAALATGFDDALVETSAPTISAAASPAAQTGKEITPKPLTENVKTSASPPKEITSHSPPVPVGAKPAPAPVAAAPADHPATKKEANMFSISSLTALASLAHAGITVAEGLGSAAPELAKGANSVITSGKAVVNDLGTVVADLKAGKYANEPADIRRAEMDVSAAIAAIEAEAAPIASLAASSTSLPSLSGIEAVLAKL